mgnify:CR=1 FL=1
MSTPIFSLSPEMQESWDYVMGQMLSFVNDTNADVDMAYDFVCEQLEIDGFVENEKAWDDFYMTWESADNRNCTQYNFAWIMTTNNPYINNLIEMGYDQQDVQVASTMFQKKTFPCVIHGRTFETEEQYHAELHEFMNGM